MKNKQIKIFGVYTHSKPSGVLFYVGKGTKQRAFSFHNRNNRWHTFIVNKYGKENIHIKWNKCKSEKTAHKREKFLIKKYKKSGIKLVNFTDGGEGISGYTHTAKARKKISITSKRCWKNPKYRSAVGNSFTGKTHSKATLKKLKTLSTLQWRDDSIRTKITKSLRKTCRTPEFRKKMGKILKKRLKDPKARKKLLSSIAKTYSSKERSRKISEGRIKWFKNKNNRLLLSRKAKKRWKNPSYKRKMIKALTGVKKRPRKNA